MRLCLLDASALSSAILKAHRPLADLGAIVAMVGHGFDRCVLVIDADRSEDLARELRVLPGADVYDASAKGARAVDVLASAAAWQLETARSRGEVGDDEIYDQHQGSGRARGRHQASGAEGRGGNGALEGRAGDDRGDAPGEGGGTVREVVPLGRVLRDHGGHGREDGHGGRGGGVASFRIVSPVPVLARYHDPGCGIELVRAIIYTAQHGWTWKPHNAERFAVERGPLETLADVAVLVGIGDEDKRAREMRHSVLGEGAAVKLVREHGSALKVWEELARGVKMPGFPGAALLRAVSREEMTRRLAEATPREDVEVGALLRLGGERDGIRTDGGRESVRGRADRDRHHGHVGGEAHGALSEKEPGDRGEADRGAGQDVAPAAAHPGPVAPRGESLADVLNAAKDASEDADSLERQRDLGDITVTDDDLRAALDGAATPSPAAGREGAARSSLALLPPTPAPVAQRPENREEPRPMTTQAPQNRSLARVEPQSHMARPADFGEEHRAVVKEAYCSGATDVEFEILWRGAVARGLDPVKKQIYFVSRNDEEKGKRVWSSQVSIDGFRAIAEATGQYEGQDEPTYQRDPEEDYLIARVTVYRKGRRPSVGVARWPEFMQAGRGGQPGYMWKKMPYHMLAKCAEALALRKAFPEDLSGLYTPDEMGNEVVTAAEKAEAITVEQIVASEEDIAATVAQLTIACKAIAERKDADAYRATLEAFRGWCERSGVPAERHRAEVKAVKADVARSVGVAGDAPTVEGLPAQGAPA